MSSRSIRPLHLSLVLAAWICLSACALRTSDAQVMSHQTYPVVPGVVPHQTFSISSYCIAYKCIGESEGGVVKATDPDPAEAQRKALELVSAACPLGVEYWSQLSGPSCRVIVETDPEPVPGGGSLYRLRAVSDKWVVKASLIYCDGSPGYKDVMIEGATKCEAIQNARLVLLCELKDPCKRAYMTYCIAKQPCQPVPACVCRPRR